MPHQLANDIFLPPSKGGPTVDSRTPLDSLKGVLISKDAARFIEFLKAGMLDIQQPFFLDEDDIHPETFFEYWGDTLEVLQTLREHGEPFPRNPKDHDDFIWAVMRSPRFKEVLAWLHEEAFEFKLHGETLLHALIERTQGREQWIEVGEALLHLGVDPNMKDREAYTPLMLAALYDHPKWASLLLAYQADWTLIHPVEHKNAVEMAKNGMVQAVFLNLQLPPAALLSKPTLRL